MYFKQFYLGCLAHASYMIGSRGEAAVVDPRRDVDSYIDEARAQGLEIKHVIETHLHADFVSGHHELARRTGARIYFGAKAGAKFDHVAVREGDEIRMGDVVLRFLETPGHTPESVSILVIDREVGDVPKAVLTGDTLFIGDVGRPDLLGATMSAQELAGMLYDSLHEKLLTLPDSVEVYPAHGAGSLCGRNISSETMSTIGEQRQFNYALRPMPKEDFVRMMTTDLPEAPAYFARDVAMQVLRTVFLSGAVVVAVICVVDWAVRTRKISPFNAVARYFRSTVDPLTAPVERKVVRAGGTPASAPLWALAAVVIGGIIIISVLDFIRVEVLRAVYYSNQGSAGIYRLLVSWTFNILKIALIVRVVSSWLPVSPYSKWISWSFRLSEPILAPLRRVVPMLGAFDITPIVAYFLLSLLQSFLLRLV